MWDAVQEKNKNTDGLKEMNEVNEKLLQLYCFQKGFHSQCKIFEETWL